MREIRTEITIAAPPERVWNTLMEFATFPDWNPFVRAISGTVQQGGRLEVHMQPPGHKESVFRPTVRAVEPNRELRWLGRVLIPGLFDGEHQWKLEPTSDGGTRFIHTEQFTGVLVPFFGTLLADSARGFETMNRALKERVECGASSHRGDPPHGGTRIAL